MDLTLLWLLLPIAAASGWYAARREYRRKGERTSYKLPQDYYRGLNYILNEQPDKAIDVFLKLSELDDSTIEIHLALGNLFRRRGEVDRAIRLHQNLVNKSTLTTELYTQALQELALDYTSAGLLDRAEDLCLELVDVDARNIAALKLLRDIYQQEKEWFRAIDVARKIESVINESQALAIAHYYCELAEVAYRKNDLAQAQRMLEKALQEDSGCARAIMLEGRIEQQLGNYDAAIATYQGIESRAPEYLPEILEALKNCYQAVGQKEKMVAYLKRIIRHHHAVDLVLTAARMLKEYEGDDVALSFLGGEVMARPSLRGVQYLLELDLAQVRDDKGYLTLIKNSLDKLLLNKPVYRCGACGFTGMEMHWCCPSCKKWSSIKPIHEFQWGASI
jgi:lipopolysaccharide biosynthesis regulator YciM